MINMNKIICAIDTSDISFAEQLVSSIEYKIIFKIGLEFYYNFGLVSNKESENPKALN